MILASTNQVIALGELLSKGGEGSVYLLPSMPGFVAKTYHEPLEASQQRKLKYMVGLGDKDIFSHTAWPTDYLLSSQRSTVVGIVMHHIHGMSPVHAAYNPKTRQKRFPLLTWEFLLGVARNTAAAFESVHKRGHVVGDVNECNVLVASDASVRLLDCDSFQIATPNEIHKCRVGVFAFTAPELQGRHLAEVRRTTNHDGFGLAVLLFHLLFNGRHPFAGRPLHPDIGGDLAANIAAYRFAYAGDNIARGLVVPAKATPLTLVPSRMQAMFHRAFTEEAVMYGRPTASEWLVALDECLDSLAICKKHCGHVFPGHLKECPWCALESEGLKLFPRLGGATKRVLCPRPFDFRKWLSDLDGIVLPPLPVIPAIPELRRTPVMVPPGRRGFVVRTVIRLASTFAVVASLVCVPMPFTVVTSVVVLLGAYLLWISAALWERRTIGALRRCLQHRLAAAEAKWAGVQNPDAGQAELEEARSGLYVLKKQHVSHERRLAALRKSAVARARTDLLREHLITFHVSTADIPGITKANRETLQGYSIWNAHDVSPRKLSAVPGFGRVKIAAMLAWKQKCEASFGVSESVLLPVLKENAEWRTVHESMGELHGRMRKDLRHLMERIQEVKDDSEHYQHLINNAAKELQQARAAVHTTIYRSDWQSLLDACRHMSVLCDGVRGKRWPAKRLRRVAVVFCILIAICVPAAIMVAPYFATSGRGPKPPRTPTPLVEQLKIALRDARSALDAGESGKALTTIQVVLDETPNPPRPCFAVWQDIVLLGRQVLLDEAHRHSQDKTLTEESVRGNSRAANALRWLMRAQIQHEMPVQALASYEKARTEFETLLEEVDRKWTVQERTKSMHQKCAKLLEYDARLHEQLCDLRGEEKDLAVAVAKYEKCIQYRLEFLGSEKTTNREIQDECDRLRVRCLLAGRVQTRPMP